MSRPRRIEWLSLPADAQKRWKRKLFPPLESHGQYPQGWSIMYTGRRLHRGGRGFVFLYEKSLPSPSRWKFWELREKTEVISTWYGIEILKSPWWIRVKLQPHQKWLEIPLQHDLIQGAWPFFRSLSIFQSWVWFSWFFAEISNFNTNLSSLVLNSFVTVFQGWNDRKEIPMADHGNVRSVVVARTCSMSQPHIGPGSGRRHTYGSASFGHKRRNHHLWNRELLGIKADNMI